MNCLIDTNVISELRRKNPAPQVLEWQKSCPLEASSISVLSLLEIRKGTEQVRQSDASFAERLDRWYYEVLLKAYAGRILPITLDICEVCASLPTKRTLPVIDGLIGATAKQAKLTLVTRNIKDFEDFGIPLINPWDYSLSQPC